MVRQMWLLRAPSKKRTFLIHPGFSSFRRVVGIQAEEESIPFDRNDDANRVVRVVRAVSICVLTGARKNSSDFWTYFFD